MTPGYKPEIHCTAHSGLETDLKNLRKEFEEFRIACKDVEKRQTADIRKCFEKIDSLKDEMAKVEKKAVWISAIVYFLIYVLVEVLKAVAPMIIQGGGK